MSKEQNLDELVKKGLAAAREGYRDLARGYFERVVEADERNERGWFGLAMVARSPAERRIALANVLTINPDNLRAKEALEKLDAEEKHPDRPPAVEAADAAEEATPQPAARGNRATLIGAGVGAGVLLLVVLVAVLVPGGDDGADAERVALNQTGTALAAVVQEQTEQARPTLPTATPFLRPTLPTAVPSRTPTPGPTATATFAGLPPPPPEVTGTLAVWGGRDLTNTGFRSVGIYTLGSNTQFIPLDDTIQGRNVRLHPLEQRLLYTRYFPSTFTVGLESANINGSGIVSIGASVDLFERDMASYCSSGNSVAFIAQPISEQFPQVFTLDLNTGALIRLTNDTMSYSWAALSPTCDRVAVVRRDTNSANTADDIVLIDTTNRTQTAVTTDQTTFVEISPRWSPDGVQLAYAAAPANDPANHDIVLRNADGSGTPVVLARHPADDIAPVFSPDGRHLAFASNRGGAYGIFIVDRFTDMTWQLTRGEDDFFPGDWR